MFKAIGSLTKFEKWLWACSSMVVVMASLIGGVSPLHLLTSLLGAAALIFMAKGHILGPLLSIAFGLLYGYISYQYAYYGEMVTYMGMTVPMAVVSVVSWLRHPYEQGEQEVAVAPFYMRDGVWMGVYTLVVTVVFYFVLAYFHTANLTLSTFSVSTSFAASYLTYRRSPLYALAYALNDVVLIGLWVLASLDNPIYVTMVVCFAMFLVNDLYGFYSWQKMHLRQQGTPIVDKGCDEMET